jgi:hypothetical protein
MSPELTDFSNQIDEQFDIEDVSTIGIISFLLSLLA